MHPANFAQLSGGRNFVPVLERLAIVLVVKIAAAAAQYFLSRKLVNFKDFEKWLHVASRQALFLC